MNCFWARLLAIPSVDLLETTIATTTHPLNPYLKPDATVYWHGGIPCVPIQPLSEAIADIQTGLGDILRPVTAMKLFDAASVRQLAIGMAKLSSM